MGEKNNAYRTARREKEAGGGEIARMKLREWTNSIWSVNLTNFGNSISFLRMIATFRFNPDEILFCH
jgi:hypothetical protein